MMVGQLPCGVWPINSRRKPWACSVSATGSGSGHGIESCRTPTAEVKKRAVAAAVEKGHRGLAVTAFRCLPITTDGSDVGTT
jgi:hypothetical protein